MVSIHLLIRAAAADPDAFRLLFRHAAREPEFRAEMDQLRATSVAVARRELARELPDPEPAWLHRAAHLVPAVALEAVMAWLDAGQPDPGQAADRIGQAVSGVIHAASHACPMLLQERQTAQSQLSACARRLSSGGGWCRTPSGRRTPGGIGTAC